MSRGLVGSVFRASVPFSGAEREVPFTVVGTSELGTLLHITILVKAGRRRLIEAWVRTSDFELLVACGIITLVSATCPECSSPMSLITDGKVSDGQTENHTPFFACGACEHCQTLASGASRHVRSSVLRTQRQSR